MNWSDKVAVGLNFAEMLEWTFTRGESLEDKIRKMAFFKLQDKNPRVDYQNLDVTVESIGVEDGEVEVVFLIKEYNK